MTAVEERLRQTEARLRQAERRAQIAESSLQELAGSQETFRPAFHAPVISQQPGHDLPPNGNAPHRDLDGTTQPMFDELFGHNHRQSIPDAELNWGQKGPHRHVEINTHELEAPPHEQEDFSWDEQLAGDRVENVSSPGQGEEEQSVTDGMASLSVEDGRAGYLGVASGAAMLRLLLPDAEHRRPLRKSTQTGAGNTQVGDGRSEGWVPSPVYAERRIPEIDMDAAIDSYFSLYHQSYPIVHEPSFRAQYAQVIPRPNGKSFNALAYIVAAIGLFTTATGPVTRDLDLFEAGKANMSTDSLETGNITLVQTLALMSNYLQKRNKPNSGYNYLGLCLNMALGLGLHKEFHNWRISLLSKEIRRRVWWSVYVFSIGAMVTFGRPLSWPEDGVEVALPLNVDDRDLTNLSIGLPAAREGLTTHSAVAIQARFHLATKNIYAKVISLNFPSAADLIRLDDESIEPWRIRWLNGPGEVPAKFSFSQCNLEWRYRNLRIIMYRPFVIRQALQQRSGFPGSVHDEATFLAVDRCLAEAKASIYSIRRYWSEGPKHILGSWYGLYFLFQAAMIPCVSLRNNPMSSLASDWREQINTVLGVTSDMWTINPASRECHQVIFRLCGGFLGQPNETLGGFYPVEESPQTQLSAVYPMMWLNQTAAETDVYMPDECWNAFITDLTNDSLEFPQMPLSSR